MAFSFFYGRLSLDGDGMFEIFEGVLNKYNGSEKKIILPTAVSAIGEFAFYNCTTIEEIIFHENITSIGQFAFYGCEKLKEVHIPENCTLIGAGAFSCCYMLEKVSLPSQLRTINKSTFYRCRSLKNIELPDWITHIDRGAFEGCTSLSDIILPLQLKSIGSTAFADCTCLKSITLPNKVTTLGDKVFLRSKNIEEITISSQLQEVGLAAFQTFGKVKFVSNDTFTLKPKMFDEHYMFNVVQKNTGNYQFVNSYMPKLNFNEWKPIAKVMLLVNYLESIDLYDENHFYKGYLEEYKDEVIQYLIEEKRFTPLNKALDQQLFKSSDIEPYFEKVTDREQKAILLDYKNKETTPTSFDDLDDLLSDLF